MFSRKTRELLNLDSIQQDAFRISASASVQRTRSEAVAVVAGKEQADILLPEFAASIDKRRNDVLAIVDNLDDRLVTAISSNKASLSIRYVFVAALVAIMLFAIVYAVVREQPGIVLLGAVLPTGAITWLLQQLRGLQDERIQLLVRVAKYRPRIMACACEECLTEVAKEIVEDLRLANA